MTEQTQKVINFAPGPAKLPEEVNQSCLCVKHYSHFLRSIFFVRIDFFIRFVLMCPEKKRCVFDFLNPQIMNILVF